MRNRFVLFVSACLLLGADLLAQKPSVKPNPRPSASAPAPAPRPVAPAPAPAPRPSASAPRPNPRPVAPMPTPIDTPRSRPQPVPRSNPVPAPRSTPRSNPVPTDAAPRVPGVSPRSSPRPTTPRTPGVDPRPTPWSPVPIDGGARSNPRPAPVDGDGSRSPGVTPLPSTPRPRPAIGGSVRGVGDNAPKLTPRDLYDRTPKPAPGTKPVTSGSISDRYRVKVDGKPVAGSKPADVVPVPAPRANPRANVSPRYAPKPAPGTPRPGSVAVVANPRPATTPRTVPAAAAPRLNPRLTPAASARPRSYADWSLRARRNSFLGGVCVPTGYSHWRWYDHCYEPCYDPCWSSSITWCLGSGSFGWGFSSWYPWHCYSNTRWYSNWSTCWTDSWCRPSCLTTSYWWWPTTVYCPTVLYTPVYTTTSTIVVDSTPVAAPRPEPTPEELARKYVDLGDFYFRENRFAEAADAYARARTYAPDDPSIHFLLADAAFATGDYHFAAFLIGEALRLDPTMAEADTDKRLFYKDVAVFEAQLQTLLKYLTDKPYDAMAHLVLGYNYRFSGKAGDARKAFARVLEIDPGSLAASLFLKALTAPKAVMAPDVIGPPAPPAVGGPAADVR